MTWGLGIDHNFFFFNSKLKQREKGKQNGDNKTQTEKGNINKNTNSRQ